MPQKHLSRAERQRSDRPGCSSGLILLLRLLAKPLTATEPVAAFDSSFVFGYDCSDSLLKEGREPQGHTVNLHQSKGSKEDSVDKQKCKNTKPINFGDVNISPYLGAFVGCVSFSIGKY